MTTNSSSSARGRRIRNALLASVFTLGVVAAAGSGVIVTGFSAFADPVHVDAPAPADFSAIVDKVAPAVVSVQVKTEVAAVSDRGGNMQDLPPGVQEFFRRFGFPRDFGNQGDNNGQPMHPREGMSQGSGFFISADGYIVTNAHVVADGKAYTVVMSDGSELDAKLIGVDQRTDIALLKVDKVDGKDFTYVSFATEQPRVGEWVLAVGNPFGLGGSVTAGIISAESRDIGSGPYDNFLQIDAPVNRGNSGGPAFNVHGEVVGMNTAIYSPSGGNVGIAFSIPASIVSTIVNQLEEHGSVTRGWLGVQIQPVTEDIAKSLGINDTTGAIVADATANGPAQGAGIQTGDIIVAVNGETVATPKDLSEKIAGIEPGQMVKITVLRDGSKKDITVKLGNLNDFDQTQQASADQGQSPNAITPGSLEGLGLTLEANPDGDGVRVADVAQDSSAADKGLQAGDVIVAVGSQEVHSVSDVESAVGAALDQGRDAVLFRVQGQNGGTHFIGVPFERG